MTILRTQNTTLGKDVLANWADEKIKKKPKIIS